MLLFGGQAAIWLAVWVVPVLGLVRVLVLSGLLEFFDLIMSSLRNVHPTAQS